MPQTAMVGVNELPTINGSDHKVVASYLGLYEEGEVKHINGFWPVFISRTAIFAALNLAHPGAI